jgi:thiol-disulfide isomerase/thioredoxin
MPAHPHWTWNTSDGNTYQDVVVTKIEPDTVIITHSLGVAHISIDLLPPDIQKQLNYSPDAASQLVALISDKLVSADGTPAGTPDASVQYYAIYYSAAWCPPCHAFTPRLVDWYKKFKPSHPNFELIFVSEDHTEAAMLGYMKDMTMPWPAVRFGNLQHDGNGTFKGSGIEQFADSGIPDLVLVDSGGKVLSDSFQNDKYVGPQAVVGDINNLIGGASPVPLPP